MGLLWVCDLRGCRAAPRPAPIFEAFHTPGVASLAFCTGDLLASGGIDGTIKFWSVQEKKPVSEIAAHAGAVLSMCRIGSLLLATLGIDGVLRIWDLDSLDAKFTCEGIDIPKFGALTSLRYDPVSGLLVHPTASGTLHVYAVAADGSKRVLPAHRGRLYAVASNGHRLATAGAEDHVLKIWSAELDRVELEERCSEGILSLSWLGDRELLAVDTQGQARAWTLDAKLVAGPALTLKDLRVCTGLPAEMLVACRERAWAESRAAILAEASQLLTRTGTDARHRLDVLVEQLDFQGCRIEAKLVSAEAARTENRPLDELAALLQLRHMLGDTPPVVPTLLALGDVLTRLSEPGLAVEAIQKALALEPENSGAKQRLEELRSAPLLNVPAEELVRGDLSHPDLVEQELRKCTLLERRFSSLVVIETARPMRFEALIECGALCAELAEPLDRLLPGQQRVTLRSLHLVLNDSVRKGQWVHVNAKGWPVSIGLESRRAASGVDVTPYILFDVGPHALQSGGAKEHNNAVARAFVTATSGGGAREWITEAQRIVIGVLRRLRDRAAVGTTEGLF